MILKTIIIFGGGYLAYRLVKSSVKESILNFLQPKEIQESAELVQCIYCERYIDKRQVIHRRKLSFCHKQCVSSYFSQEQ